MILPLLAGVAFLVAGAELLVRGASRLALALRIPPLIVGLTVVAFGTSSPELAVSIEAALAGHADIAIGNVVGSNIFNVLLILGAAALVAPLRVSSQLVRLDVPVMIVVSVMLLSMAWDGRIGRLDGVLLLVALLAYLAYLFRAGRKAAAETEPDPGRQGRGAIAFALDGGFIVAGLILLVLGSDWLVEGSRLIATRMGVSELLIGLTVVAAGTSLPELATSVVAAVRGERDIAVGNVVGSNIFNILAILGIAATVAPAGLVASAAAATFDIPVMTAVAVVCLPVFVGGTIERWEGGLFVAYYIAYAVYLALDATDHGALPQFRNAMIYFVIPLTVLTLAVMMLRSWKARP